MTAAVETPQSEPMPPEPIPAEPIPAEPIPAEPIPAEQPPLEAAGPKAESRLYILDLLRFGAAFLVMMAHLMPVAAQTSRMAPDQFFTYPIYQFTRYGWMGVDLFFLISGFVICM